MNKFYIATIALILTIVLAMFLLWPEYQNFQTLNLTVQNKETELQTKEDYFSHLREISQKLSEHQGNLAKIDSALPEDFSLPSLFDYFQKTASQQGLLLIDINLGSIITPDKSSNRIKEISLTFELSGYYSNFKNFLSTIEKSAKLIEIENISYSFPEKEELFSFQIESKTYTY